MRDFKFTESERPTMANFNARFDAIAALTNGLGNEYVWEKTRKTVQKEIGATGLMYLCASNKGSSTVQYADACEVSSDGSLALKNPISVSVSTLVSYGANFLRGKYFFNPNPPGDNDWVKGIVYIHPTDGDFFESTYSSLCTRGGSLYIPYVKTEVFGYVNSPDPTAYPPAVSDGYTYTASGQFGEKTRIATGSYVGTGTYGGSNPNILTFDFEPKLVIVQALDGTQYNTLLFLNKNKESGYPFQNLTSNYCNGYIYGNTVKWENQSSPDYQLNSAETYYYIAIG